MYRGESAIHTAGGIGCIRVSCEILGRRYEARDIEAGTVHRSVGIQEVCGTIRVSFIKFNQVMRVHYGDKYYPWRSGVYRRANLS